MISETNLNIGFVVLLTDGNTGLLQTTISSIKSNHPNRPCTCIVPEDISESLFKEVSGHCPTYKGGKTYTSLVNSGMSNTPTDWSIVLVAGTYVMKGLIRKLCFPLRSAKDVVFAITPQYDRQGRPTELHATFPEASLNGMVIHRNTFEECGELTDNPIFLSKTFWCLEAIQKGYTFKGVLAKAL